MLGSQLWLRVELSFNHSKRESNVTDEEKLAAIQEIVDTYTDARTIGVLVKGVMKNV